MNPLQIFPRHPSAPDTYYINGAWAPAAITAVDKRFTDAELAAEVHAQRQEWAATLYDDVYAKYVEDEGELTSMQERMEMGDKAKTLYRFATLPHHDDGPA